MGLGRTGEIDSVELYDIDKEDYNRCLLQVDHE